MMNGFSWGGMWFGWIFWLLLLAVIIWAVVAITNNNNRKQQNYFPREEDALEILKKRYTRVEINKEQFERIKNDLHSRLLIGKKIS
ncbi:MAG: electron transporter RnfE [Ignavibacteriales bacterium CG_4_9_14_3_um_filter_30_11]|nr:MAG: electron transporter RnfE [Ignavibacteriales bacterium CG_4_9_14_3_um_filter_30_11]